MSDIAEAKRELIDAGGRTAQSFGINRLLGQIYALLFLGSEPLCLDEIAENLGVSKASISITCRQLEGWGAVRRVWKKGDRKDYYEPVTDFGHIINNGFMTSINKKLLSARIQIEHCREILCKTDSADDERKFIEKRLAQAEKYRTRIEKLLNNPLVKKLL